MKLKIFLILFLLPFCVRAQTAALAISGNFGSNGSVTALKAPAGPSYATVSVSGNSTYTWADGVTCWYSPGSFTISVNLTDGLSHKVTLFLKDDDNQGRVETVSEGSVSQQVSNFSAGTYVSFTVSGNVQFSITKSSGPNAVATSVLFDPATIAHQVILNWTGTAPFNVYRNGTKISSLITSPTYTDTSVVAGQTYTYTVSSVVNGVESTQAPITSFTIPSP